ncbi:hypothetical protein GE09DRAFT_1157631 [Coniochaeta sp. 2T2.1]|nr:hypothetical protein GE09DRAFT_1157631 [Coniochaeta sp. 2T2.1]
MSLTPGIPLTTFRLIPPRSAGEVHLQRANLMRDFARFLAVGWENRLPAGVDVLSDLPFRGKLGSSLRQRLEKMRDELPVRFKPVVLDVLKSLPEIEALPWVLTHGDFVSDNIMVEPPLPSSSSESYRNRSTGHWPGSLRGLIDWAESEYLPFGICLYGAEELLGQTVRTWDPTAKEEKSRFAYYPSAGDLRRLFWHEMEVAVPPLARDKELRGTVEQARLLGILLWHGFAFDDGAIDRVVEEGRDRDEVQRLDMFLFGTDERGTDERGMTERGMTGSGGGGGGEKGVGDGAKGKGKEKAAVDVSEKGKGKEREVSKGQKFLRRMSSMISL